MVEKRLMEEALKRYKAAGASHADDAALMAAFCKHDLQLVVGAVSPRLVWDGAQSEGMTTSALAALAVSDPLAVSDLQWKA